MSDSKLTQGHKHSAPKNSFYLPAIKKLDYTRNNQESQIKGSQINKVIFDENFKKE